MCFGPSWTLGKLNNLGSYWALFGQRQPCVLMQKKRQKNDAKSIKIRAKMFQNPGL